MSSRKFWRGKEIDDDDLARKGYGEVKV